mmetsp:Transcript_25188/g.84638  ORF Transcript_25188/g.84638 Transcript_25188/m.84638 type:complete len:233 (+) Transcript_25188:927-1625(+)
MGPLDGHRPALRVRRPGDVRRVDHPDAGLCEVHIFVGYVGAARQARPDDGPDGDGQDCQHLAAPAERRGGRLRPHLRDVFCADVCEPDPRFARLQVRETEERHLRTERGQEVPLLRRRREHAHEGGLRGAATHRAPSPMVRQLGVVRPQGLDLPHDHRRHLRLRLRAARRRPQRTERAISTAFQHDWLHGHARRVDAAHLRDDPGQLHAPAALQGRGGRVGKGRGGRDHRDL